MSCFWHRSCFFGLIQWRLAATDRILLTKQLEHEPRHTGGCGVLKQLLKSAISMLFWGLAVLTSLLHPGRAAATTWNVADFGARGDAVQTLATTVSNSTQISLEITNQYSAADVGKLIELFGVGPVTSGTNRQDLIGYILSVTNGTNMIISVPASQTATDVNCTIGTENAGAFQNCVNACQGTNAVVMIPAGCYLLVPPKFLTPILS